MSNDHHRIRKELVGFLGAPSDWSGCYPPFSPFHMRMFQIAVKPGCLETSSPSTTGIKMLHVNLLRYVTHDVAAELSGYVEEVTPPEEESKHWVSQCSQASGSLNAVLEGCEVTLRGERTQAKDLVAKVRRTETVSDAHYPRIREAVGQVARSLGKAFGRRPANLYVVVGVEYVDVTATAETGVAVGVGATLAGTGGGGDATNRTTDKAIATDMIALVRLLQYPTKEVTGSSIDSDEAVSWTIGEEVPLDDDADIDSGIYSPREAFASVKISHENQDELANADESVEWWTIGEEVPLDDDADIDSGIYTPQEAFASVKIRHENQPELANADESEEPAELWTIGEEVPLDDDDDIDSGIYTRGRRNVG